MFSVTASLGSVTTLTEVEAKECLQYTKVPAQAWEGSSAEMHNSGSFLGSVCYRLYLWLHSSQELLAASYLMPQDGAFSVLDSFLHIFNTVLFYVCTLRR